MTDEIVKISDSFYILSTSARIDDRTRVLKHGDTFAVFDRFGDIEEMGLGRLSIFGIYDHDTRYLSRLRLRVTGSRPLLLGSTIKDDNALLAVDLMNSDLWHDGDVAVQRGTIHIQRTRCLWSGSCFERVLIRNYGLRAVELSLTLEFGADFADIFEVRGMARERTGRTLAPHATRSAVTLGYEGLDGAARTTTLRFDPAPPRLSDSEAGYDFQLEPGGEASFRVAIACAKNDAAASHLAVAEVPHPGIWYEDASRLAVEALAQARAEEPRIYTSNEQFNDWLERSLADLHMMRTETPQGAYPYAGVPWFSTAFGRDGIITALECLWGNPAVAKNVLQFLAATQATETRHAEDAQPGKILHEIRGGEMAATGEVPFGRYYGSVDATPLFVVLAGEYYERTGDRALVQSIWPNVEHALSWIRDCGDPDGDGFVEYARRAAHGLIQQGWKDSHDSIFHEDGTIVEGPTALCEVQGYVYAAYKAAGALAEALGFKARAKELSLLARELRRRFEQQFWCAPLATYALALDGDKRPCRVRASNAGHCLFAGIASLPRARLVASTLTGDAVFSGWGIRTVASSERRYSPMSYHNGSVWPHDNALIAAGFARYGLQSEALRVFAALFDASLFFDLHRMPELFCGFPRRPGEGPTAYPVSCSPQSWSAGAVLLLIQASLGLEVRALEKKVVFTNPILPEFLTDIRIQNLRVGDASLDLSLTRHEHDVGINVLRRDGPVSVVTIS